MRKSESPFSSLSSIFLLISSSLSSFSLAAIFPLYTAWFSSSIVFPRYPRNLGRIFGSSRSNHAPSFLVSLTFTLPSSPMRDRNSLKFGRAYFSSILFSISSFSLSRSYTRTPLGVSINDVSCLPLVLVEVLVRGGGRLINCGLRLIPISSPPRGINGVLSLSSGKVSASFGSYPPSAMFLFTTPAS